MDIKLAEKVLQHFDYKTIEVLNAYIESRRAEILMLLTREKETDVLRQQQGMLEELRTLSKIRDYAVAIVDEGNRYGR